MILCLKLGLAHRFVCHPSGLHNRSGACLSASLLCCSCMPSHTCAAHVQCNLNHDADHPSMAHMCHAVHVRRLAATWLSCSSDRSCTPATPQRCLCPPAASIFSAPHSVKAIHSCYLPKVCSALSSCSSSSSECSQHSNQTCPTVGLHSRQKPSLRNSHSRHLQPHSCLAWSCTESALT